MSGKTDGYPQIDKCYPQWWQTPDIDPTKDWSNSIQRAVDFYPEVYFPTRVQNSFPVGYPIMHTIHLNLSKTNTAYFNTVDPGFGAYTNQVISYHLYGSGDGAYFETSDYNIGGAVFDCINIPVSGYNQGLVFENLKFNCKRGIEILGGEINNPFGNEKNTVAKVKILNCTFYGKHSVNSTDAEIAISLRRVFDCIIKGNHFQDFQIGIKMEGCDLNNISENRIIQFYKYAILDLSNIYKPEDPDFNFQCGSQNSIIHNDILMYKGENFGVNNNQNVGSFIKSNSLHIIIRDNFLENQPINSTSVPIAYIDCSNINLNSTNVPLVVDITGNRLSTHTQYSYLINEDFRSLNLSDAPIARGFDDGMPPSSFVKNNNTLTTVDDLPINFGGRPKAITISNVFSFREWQSFRTSNLIQNSFDGAMIINSSNISDLGKDNYDIANPPELTTINPKTFNLKKEKKSSLLSVQISQKLRYNSDDDNLLPKFLKIKMVTRNKKISEEEDFYFAIDEVQVGGVAITVWGGRGKYLSSNTTDMTYNNFNIYEIRPTCAFKSNLDYYLKIVSKVDSEVKSIILEPVINAITIGDAAVSEGGILAFPITISNPTNSNMSLTFGFTNISALNNDYTTTTITKNIAAGVTSDIVSVQTTSDTDIEPNETFKIAITGLGMPAYEGNTSDTAIGTILNDDIKSVKKIAASDVIKENEKEEIYKIDLKNEIKIFPNPIKDILNLDIKESDVLTKVEIYDETGKFIEDLTHKINNNSIDISYLANGSYIVKIVTINNNSEIIIKKQTIRIRKQIM